MRFIDTEFIVYLSNQREVVDNVECCDGNDDGDDYIMYVV